MVLYGFSFTLEVFGIQKSKWYFIYVMLYFKLYAYIEIKHIKDVYIALNTN